MFWVKVSNFYVHILKLNLILLPLIFEIQVPLSISTK